MTRALTALHRRVFADTPPDVEVLLRTLIGLLVCWWSLSWVTDAASLLSDQSIYPTEPDGRFTWTVFTLGSPTWFVAAVLIAVAVAGAGLVSGRAARASVVVAFVGLVSIQRLQPAALNAGDQLLRLLLVWMVVALLLGSGATFTGSLRSPGKPRPRIFVVGVRLQVVVIYTTSVIWKLQGSVWRDGDAVYAPLHNPSVTSIGMPSWIAESTAAIGVLTYAVLIIEASLPMLLLSRARLLGIGLAVVLHTTFAIFLRVGIFTPAMIVAVLAFAEPDDVRRLLDNVVSRTSRRTSSTAADDQRLSAA